MKLADIPRFRVSKIHSRPRTAADAVDRMSIEGTFSSLDGVRIGPARLYVSPTDAIEGDLEVLDGAHNVGMFTIPATSTDSRIGVDAVFPWIDGIWVPRQVATITDKERRWTRATFAPRDAMRYKLSPGSVLPRATEENEGTLVTGGWDHEHCALCWEMLGAGGLPIGFVDENDNWVCEECFEHFVSTHSLGF